MRGASRWRHRGRTRRAARGRIPIRPTGASLYDRPMSKAPGDTTQDAVASLIGAADTDTLFRDIYLRRARALIAPRCSATRYHAIRNDVEEIARLLQHARAAMARQDWEQVRDLGSRAETLQRAVDADAVTMDLARLVYEASPVALDPFSP